MALPESSSQTKPESPSQTKGASSPQAKGLSCESRVARARQQKKKEAQRVRQLIAKEHETAYREAKLGRPGPTPETRRKLRRHPVEDLYERGVLDDGHLHALSAIEDAFGLITHGVRLRLSSPIKVDGSGKADGMTERNMEVVDIYGDWVDALAAERMLPCFRVCIDIGVEGLSLSAISRRRGMNKNTIKKRLLEGLGIYLQVKRKRRRR